MTNNDKFFNAAETLRRAANALGELEGALDMTGNSKLAARLSDIAWSIAQATTQAQHAFVAEVQGS